MESMESKFSQENILSYLYGTCSGIYVSESQIAKLQLNNDIQELICENFPQFSHIEQRNGPTLFIDIPGLFGKNANTENGRIVLTLSDFIFSGNNIYYYLCGQMDRNNIITGIEPPEMSIDAKYADERLLNAVPQFSKIAEKYVISDINCVDIMYRIAEICGIFGRKCMIFLPSLLYRDNARLSMLKMEYKKADPDAKDLRFTNISNAGIDISVIKLLPQKPNEPKNVYMYDTGIIIKPPFGYYFELFPRSSIYKTGYILANSVGVVDASYRGTVRITLIKTDPNMPDLPLPYSMGQLVLKKQHYFEAVQVDNIDANTTRGEAGFGSTGTSWDWLRK